MENYPDGHAFFKIDGDYLRNGIEAALTDEDWTVAFKAIDDMRVANKFHSGDMAESLDFLAPLIKAAVDNLRSNISKNALTLCKELYMNKAITGESKYLSQMITFVQATLPSLLTRT